MFVKIIELVKCYITQHKLQAMSLGVRKKYKIRKRSVLDWILQTTTKLIDSYVINREIMSYKQIKNLEDILAPAL